MEVCYSPARALELAARTPDREVVFLAIGFETTIAPVVGIAGRGGSAQGVANFSLLTAFKLVPPALRALLADPEVDIDAFLCPAHVSAIIGADAYSPFTAQGRRALRGRRASSRSTSCSALQGILEQLVDGEARVENQYSRVVKPGGNPKALALMETLPGAGRRAVAGHGAAPAERAGAARRTYRAYDAAIAPRHRVGPGTRQSRLPVRRRDQGQVPPPGLPPVRHAPARPTRDRPLHGQRRRHLRRVLQVLRLSSIREHT